MSAGVGAGEVGEVEFDPFSSSFFDDPYPLYRRLRDEAPVCYSPRYGGFYTLSRYWDVVAANKDWETFSSSHGVELSTLSSDPEALALLESLIMMDPPAHDRLRALVSRVFTPRAVQELEPMIRRVVGGFVDQIGDRREFDAITDLAGPFPVEVISEMLGVPSADRQQIRSSLDLALHREPGGMHPTAAGRRAAVELGTMFYELAVAKRAAPGDDITSQLTKVRVNRGDGQETGLSDIEIAGFSSLLGGAGAETVTKLVGNAFVLFHRNPGQWQKLLDHPELIPSAVEEILRYLPPAQYNGRFTLADAEFDGGIIPAGFPVLLLTGAATRDERFYDDPDSFLIDRSPTLALGFGLGIHSCLGAALARSESRIVLEEMLRRWPRFEVDEAGLERVHMANVAGYSKVPVRVV